MASCLAREKPPLTLSESSVRFSGYVTTVESLSEAAKAAPKRSRQGMKEAGQIRERSSAQIDVQDVSDEGAKLGFGRAVTIRGELLRHIAAPQKTHL
jgi:hypothetical protein